MIDNRPIRKLEELEKRLDEHEVILAQLQLGSEYAQALEKMKQEEVTNNGI